MILCHSCGSIELQEAAYTGAMGESERKEVGRIWNFTEIQGELLTFFVAPFNQVSLLPIPVRREFYLILFL